MLFRDVRTLCAGVGVALFLAAGPSRGAAQEFQIDPKATNSVKFVSRASIEQFEGVTDRIDGYVRLNGPTLSATTGGDATELYLEVDLASLDTGIGLRNRHMRDNYLHVAKFPYATFGGKILRTEESSGGEFRITVVGDLTIHGVTKKREITCRVAAAAAGYRSICAFEVLLSDYNVEIPKVMFLKLANEIQLQLDFTMTRGGNQNGDSR